jgi:ATP-binding cassette subfamily B multidrug efflux pump
MANRSDSGIAKSIVSPPIAMGSGHMRGMTAKVQAKNTKGTVLRIWSYLHRQRMGLISVSILAALSALLLLSGPFLMKVAMDEYIIPRNYNGLLWICVWLLIVYAGGAVMAWIQAYVMTGVAQRTVWEMRNDLFGHLQKLPLPYFDSKTHGEIMSRTTNDIENVTNTLNQSVTQLISSFLTIVGSIVFMLILNVWLTLVTLLIVPIAIFVTGQIAKRTRKYYSIQQKHLGELNGFIEETISGQKVVKTFHREEKATEEFQVINTKLKKVGIKAQILTGFIPPVMNVINNLSLALVASTGGLMAFYNLVSIGVIVAFIQYSKQFSRPLNELANQFNMIQSAIAGAERVFEVMDELTEQHETGPESLRMNQVRGEVVFHQVCFNYKPDVPILTNISLTASPGQTIALVGPTGAGKTTIVNLLTRFYDIDSGSITIDGVNIQTLDKNSLRSQLGIVLQDAYLFSDTILENIRFGRLAATDSEIYEAAKLANADTFIKKLPQGYDTLLTAEGNNLSHGQRQLITIARAILANPAILILDEATSSVDTRTEMYIQEAMNVLMKGRTSFVIAHRLSTIREADLILVMNGGEIIERGTHQQLLEAKGFYYNLYTSQFKRAVGSAV